jgi:aldehyde dehydrogenase (NAD(P)+)
MSPEAPRSTARAELDVLLARLHQNAAPFARTSPAERIDLARAMMDGYVAVAEEQVRAGCARKGLDFDSAAAGEEWLGGPVLVLRCLRLLIETMSRLAAGEPAVDPARVRTRGDGRVIVDVFPASRLDAVLFAGFRGEAWIRPGIPAAEVPARAAPHYRKPVDQRQGRVALVLGAGNVPSIPPLDVLHKMFVEGKVCLLKMNPVNDHVGPFIERAFAAAIDKGWLAVAYGGADVGAHLVQHPLVDEVHMTGSDKTHDMMVWGPPGAEREARKARRQPLLDKPISSELGNITPVIVVPGPYSEGELAFQADNIGTAVTQNASFNCNAAKMLVLPREWDGSGRLMRALGSTLARTPLRKAYYPGAESRWKELVEAHPEAQRFGTPAAGELPWAIIPDLDPASTDEKCFAMEPFCAVVSQTAVGTSDPVTFLREAVSFCNQRLWGTLAASIVVHPRSLKDPAVALALEQAIADLRYGAVAVNHWPALVYGFISTPWGGHPSSTIEDIQSGSGFVHNTFMLEDVEKCVVRGPLVARPKPAWFVGNRTADRIGRKMVAMEAAPSWAKVPPLVLAALWG